VRLGIVCGRVVLSKAVPSLEGTRFLMVEPVTAENLAARSGRGGGKALVVADHLAPERGEMIAFVEGREGANAYWPRQAPVDAYCALIVTDVDFELRPGPHTLPGREVGR
jgi:microcompartment protein CcmK/EutM